MHSGIKKICYFVHVLKLLGNQQVSIKETCFIHVKIAPEELFRNMLIYLHVFLFDAIKNRFMLAKLIGSIS